MFYNLVRIFRLRQEGEQVRASSQGRHEHLAPEVAQAVEDAIAELGPGAIEAQVRNRSAEICRERGLPQPSRNAVWTRFGRPNQAFELGPRLGVSAGAILDCCPLAIDVEQDGHSYPANLLTLVDVSTGVMPGRALIAGLPTPDDVIRVLRKHPNAKGASIVSSSGIPPQVVGELSQNPDRSVSIAPIRSLRAGAATRAIFGLRIGRVPLAPRRKEVGGPDVPPPLPFDQVREVVHALVDERNAELQDA
ncbi:hypothetical protein [Sphingomonas aerophila]|uniref:Uncharacterized protein n=1 Tax=Sphingomonas aerophila TaxID=1344948 RepID=A0A7W9BFE3_9SPHN|nr:hypothetical protein [Sphingomonas aerophila]MBB5716250.1 hypothetical protein [Sphingomonas aerophila]